jgi:hypothetical protein
VSGCTVETGAPRALVSAPRIEAKNAFFAQLAAIWRRLHGSRGGGAS